MKKYIIPNTKGNYMINKGGNVFSRKGENELKQHISSYGYKRVCIKINGNSKIYAVHRLLAYVFLGLNIEDKTKYVCHKNDNKSDNRLCNLYIGNAKTNSKDKKNNNIKLPISSLIKLSLEQIVEIKNKINEGGNITHIANKYGISRTFVHRIKSGKAHKSIDENYIKEIKNNKHDEMIEKLVDIYLYMVNLEEVPDIAHKICSYLVEIERFDHP